MECFYACLTQHVKPHTVFTFLTVRCLHRQKSPEILSVQNVKILGKIFTEVSHKFVNVCVVIL